MSLKTGLAGLALIAGTTAAGAQPAPDAPAANAVMAACASIENRRSRLDCYDAMAKAGVVAPAAPGMAPPTAPPPPAGGVTGPAEEPSFNSGRGRRSAPPVGGAPAGAPVATGDTFGMDTVRQPAKVQNSKRGERTARVVSATDSGIGHWRITLDSGAVWEMTERVPNFRAPAAGDEVGLRRNRFGSYFIDFDHQQGVRVTRIR